MSECRYIPQGDLPALAPQEQIERAKYCLEAEKMDYHPKTLRYMREVWFIYEWRLRRDIINHLSEGKRVFRKFEHGGSSVLLQDKIQANVTLFGDEPALDADIYVEIGFRQRGVFVNAHEHEQGIPRLPQ